MKPSWLFNPDPERYSLRTLRFLAVLMAVYTVGSLLFFLFLCVQDYAGDRVVLLDVQNFSEKNTYMDLKYNGFNYVTGQTGRLHYTTASFYEMLVLKKVARQGLVHVLVQAFIALILFLQLRKVHDRRPFSDRLTKTVAWSGILLVLLPLLAALFDQYVANACLKQQTGNRFELESRFDIHHYVLPMMVIFSLLYFLKRGVELQDRSV